MRVVFSSSFFFFFFLWGGGGGGGSFNSLTAMLAVLSLGKRPIKVPNLKPLRLKFFCFLPMSTGKEFYQNGQY